LAPPDQERFPTTPPCRLTERGTMVATGKTQLAQEVRRRVDATVPDFVRNREELYREEEGRVLEERLGQR
jgi:hypothetical protein